MVLPGSGGLLCIYKRHAVSWDKESGGRSLPGIWAWYSPLKLDTIDQVWPENFGGLYKAPGCIAGHDASDASQCRGLILQA
jgi:hypothetical protein